MAFDFALAWSTLIQGVVDEDTFEALREDGSAVEVARLFINDAYEIVDDIDTLMSAPTPSVISPSALCLGNCLILIICSGNRREEPEVDFDEVEALTQQLMRCTSR